jgi:hypothetical protein
MHAHIYTYTHTYIHIHTHIRIHNNQTNRRLLRQCCDEFHVSKWQIICNVLRQTQTTEKNKVTHSLSAEEIQILALKLFDAFEGKRIKERKKKTQTKQTNKTT